jgi:tripartite-type tricarboxylate transporter receptor subunit TctC
MAAALADALMESDPGLVVQVECLASNDGAGAILALVTAQGDELVASTCTPTFFTTPIKKALPVRYTDLTPLAGLVRDTYFIAVRSSEPASDVQQLFAGPTTVACAPRGGNTHIQAICLSELVPGVITPSFQPTVAAAVEAVMDGSARWTTGVLSDFADRVSTGEIRLLASLGEGEGPVPSLAEAGVPFHFPLWRGLIGPGRLTGPAVERWSRRLGGIGSTVAWSNYLSEAKVDFAFLSPERFAALLDEEAPRYSRWLDQLEGR